MRQKRADRGHFFIYPNPKVEIAKIVLSLALSVFAKNISPTHRFGGYFL
ncbi:hypothetical protein MNB_SUP05-SYMBIONT-7-339 [hydrothermal vent metagenome]|uniref:Uncharacterized protein n=1 Tax=hydrothermal vent metagenome TaxID=652676 RepID=A0A1W1E351_9ZZZZ